MKPAFKALLMAPVLGGLVLFGSQAQSTASASAAESAGFAEVSTQVAPHTANVTVALVAPPGTWPHFSREEAARSAEAAASFIEAETDGQIQVEIEFVSDWLYSEETWPCSWSGAWQGWATEQLGWEGGPGRHLSVMVPDREPCPTWANGSLGWGVPAGGVTFQPGFDASTLAHEWGHNFGLAHAFSTSCPTWDFTAIDGRTPPECARTEYGNRLDLLGSAWTMTPFSSPSLSKLGMLPRHFEPQCGSQTTSVRSVAEGAANRDAISWESSTEPGVRYWVDYRDSAQRAKYANLHVSPWAFSPDSSGLQILRTDPEVSFGATVLERPEDGSDYAQLVRPGESVRLTDGTTVSWVAEGDQTRTASVTVQRAC